MEKAIKKLLSKETLSGDDVGRIMILDLIAAYKNLSEGGEGTGVLSNAQKIKIVDNITNSSDISRYSDYKGVHDYLITVPAVYESFSKAYETYRWKICHLLTDMKHSEYENIFSCSRPVIMTKPQYERFVDSGEPVPHQGIAILQGELGRNDSYTETPPEWRANFSAENILEAHSVFINNALDGMKDALCECLARQQALELIGRYIKVSKVKILISPIDDKVELFNEFVQIIINSVVRPGYPEGYERELKKNLLKLFAPIDMSLLTPEPKAVIKARRALTFSLIKNGSEAFVSMLKREWRNECFQ